MCVCRMGAGIRKQASTSPLPLPVSHSAVPTEEASFSSPTVQLDSSPQKHIQFTQSVSHNKCIEKRKEEKINALKEDI